MQIILTAKERDQRKAIVAAVNAATNVDEQELRDGFDSIAFKIVEAFRGCTPNLWTYIDNAVGDAANIGLTHPWMVRRVRNDPHWGAALNEAMQPRYRRR